jgi:hypothetical protein
VEVLGESWLNHGVCTFRTPSVPHGSVSTFPDVWARIGHQSGPRGVELLGERTTVT